MDDDRPALDPLTRREEEILGLLAEGKTNAEIGEALGISFLTARNHVASILSKLGVGTREEAGAWWRGQRVEAARPSRRGRAWLAVPALGLPLKVAAAAVSVAAIGAVVAGGLLLAGNAGTDTGDTDTITLEDCPLDAVACEFAREAEAAVTGEDAVALAGLMRSTSYTCPDEIDPTDALASLCQDAEPGTVLEGFDVYGGYSGEAETVAPPEVLPFLFEDFAEGMRLLSIACPETEDVPVREHCRDAVALVFESDEAVVRSEGSEYAAPPLLLIALASRGTEGFGITGLASHFVHQDLLLGGGVPEEAAFAYLNRSLSESIFFPVGPPAEDRPFVALGDACPESTPQMDRVACDVVTTVERLMREGDADGVLALLPPVTFTCVPELAENPACADRPEGATFDVYTNLGETGGDLNSPDGFGFSPERLRERLARFAPGGVLRTVGCQGNTFDGNPFGPARCDDYVTLVFAGGEGADAELMAIEINRVSDPNVIQSASFLFDAFPETALRAGGPLPGREEPAYLSALRTAHPIEGAFQPAETPEPGPPPTEQEPAPGFDPGPRPEVEARPIEGCPAAEDACAVAAVVAQLYTSGDERIASFGRPVAVQCSDTFTGGIDDPMSLVCGGQRPGAEVAAVPVSFEFTDLLHPPSYYAEYARGFGSLSRLVSVGCPEPEGAAQRCIDVMAMVFHQERQRENDVDGPGPPVVSVVVLERDATGEWGITRFVLSGLPRELLLDGGEIGFGSLFDLPRELLFTVLVPAAEAGGCPEPLDELACALATEIPPLLAAGDIDGLFAALPSGIGCPLPGGVESDPCESFPNPDAAELFRFSTDQDLPGVTAPLSSELVEAGVIREHLAEIGPGSTLAAVACGWEPGPDRGPEDCRRMVSLIFATPREGSADPEITIIGVAREPDGTFAPRDVSFVVSSFPRLVLVEGGAVPEGVPEAISEFRTFFAVE